jgi:heme exporter protein A
VLEADELECERGGWVIFRELSFALGAGESLRIAGANGSGKTSLLRILCGLLPPSRGEVRWRDTAIRGLREEYATQLVYLGHAPAVKDDLSAAENLSISCALAGMPASAQAIGEALARFGLAGKNQPSLRLSQGQRRRAALARLALSAARPLWLLDEPFSALDAAGVGLLRGLIEAHLGRGGAVVFTTHQDAGIAAARVIDLDPAS